MNRLHINLHININRSHNKAKHNSKNVILQIFVIFVLFSEQNWNTLAITNFAITNFRCFRPTVDAGFFVIPHGVGNIWTKFQLFLGSDCVWANLTYAHYWVESKMVAKRELHVAKNYKNYKLLVCIKKE